MTDNPGAHSYKQGEIALEREDAITALRWWLRSLDEGHADALESIVQLTAAGDGEISDPWNQLLRSMQLVSGDPNQNINTSPVADWSQFTLAPTHDLELLLPPVSEIPLSMRDTDDEAWHRVLDVLEYKDAIVDSLGANLVAGNWEGEFGIPVMITFGVDSRETPQRKLRISSPMLIGLPEPGMAPNAEPASPIPQSGFPIPLRSCQVLFARACLASSDIGLMATMPAIKFGVVLPDDLYPTQRISAGYTHWIVGPQMVHRLRKPLPQVTVGYEIDLRLSGPHLASAVAGCVDSLVTSISRTTEACRQLTGLFCEFITCIPLPLARDQWDALFATEVYPPEFSLSAVLAESRAASAMSDLGAMLSATPGFEADGEMWIDRAIAVGYAPALREKMWNQLRANEFSSAVSTWNQHRDGCWKQILTADPTVREMLESEFGRAMGYAAIAAFLGGADFSSVAPIWAELAAEGRAESRLSPVIASLIHVPLATDVDISQAARQLTEQYPAGEWLSSVFVNLADGFLRSDGMFAHWCLLGLRICLATGAAIRCTDIGTANHARDMARHLFDANEEAVAEALQEAAVRFGLPYAGSDHSWRLLDAGRFTEAIALFDEVAEVVQARVAAFCEENPDLSEVWNREWANYMSNIALCRIASDGDYAWATQAWNAGAPSGNVESIFYPAVVHFRRGDPEVAQRLVAEMEPSVIASMTPIAMEGSRSSAPFWREWSLDSLRLLQPGDTSGFGGPSAGGGLSSSKSPFNVDSTAPAEPLRDSVTDVSAAPTYRFCPECGQSRVPQAKFCTECGFAFPLT